MFNVKCFINTIPVFIFGCFILFVSTFYQNSQICTQNVLCEAPVIYVYGAEDAQHIKISIGGNITCEYPKRDVDGAWDMITTTMGPMLDSRGIAFDYLFWEGNGSMTFDFSRGFCVAGKDAGEFLEKATTELGLSRTEANAFIMYWLPRLEKNEYNIISFQGSNYSSMFPITTEPAYSNILRVFMAFRASDTPDNDIVEQDLKAMRGTFERKGITIVEWGGCEVKKSK